MSNKNKYLSACLDFSDRMVNSRIRNNHKKETDKLKIEKDSQQIQITGLKMALKRIHKIIVKIEGNEK